MKEVSEGQGRTVLFVSHNMAAVKSICNKALLLENGRLKNRGTSSFIVAQYLTTDLNVLNFAKVNIVSNKDNFLLEEVGVRGTGKGYSDPIVESDQIEISIKYQSDVDVDKKLHFTFALKDEDGQYIIAASSDFLINHNKKGEKNATMLIPPFYFHHSRSFYLDILIVENRRNVLINAVDIVSFFINPSQKEIGDWLGKSRACIRGQFDWEGIK